MVIISNKKYQELLNEISKLRVRVDKLEVNNQIPIEKNKDEEEKLKKAKERQKLFFKGSC